MSVYSAEEIEADIYRLFKGSLLSKAITGRILLSGQREKNSAGEDVVISFYTGLDKQIQRGIVLIHIYVPDAPIAADGELSKDRPRIKQLTKIARSVIDGYTGSDYQLWVEDTPTSHPVEGLSQHFVNIILQFKRPTF